MDVDAISKVSINEAGELRVVPASQSFPYIYREAMEVHWDPEERALWSPAPREWSYARWFQQILAAARASGCELRVEHCTQWINVPAPLRKEFAKGFSSDS